MQSPIDQIPLTIASIPLMQEYPDPAPDTELYEIEKIRSATYQHCSQAQLVKEAERLWAETERLKDLANKKAMYAFVIHVNEDLSVLGHLINDYNAASTLSEKQQALLLIQSKKDEIDRKYPDNLINNSPGYQQRIDEGLTTEIQQQVRSLQLLTDSYQAIPLLNVNTDPSITSMQTLARATAMPRRMLNALGSLLPIRRTATHAPQTLADWITEMDQRKVVCLMESLANLKSNDIGSCFEQVYQPSEPEYNDFMRFISSHSITRLGNDGKGNAINYQVTDLNTSDSVILKLDNRLDRPRQIAGYLAAGSLSDVLIPEEVARRATYVDSKSGTKMTRSLVVQRYCPGGDLRQHSIQQTSLEQRTDYAFDIYQKMGNVLLKMRQDHGAFPDMKNTNWLFDGDQLLIADDKSLRVGDSSGFLEAHTPQNKWYGSLLRTKGLVPPEMLSPNPIEIDKMHVFIWGKNLYDYLVAHAQGYSNDDTDGKNFNFNHPIFEGVDGDALRQLIIQTVNPQPANRLSMPDAIVRLRTIQSMRQTRQRCLEQLRTLPSNQVNDFIRLKLYSATNDAELQSLKPAINNPTLYCENNPEFNEYKHCCELFDEMVATAPPPSDGQTVEERRMALQKDFIKYAVFGLAEWKRELTQTLKEIKMMRADYDECQALLAKIEPYQNRCEWMTSDIFYELTQEFEKTPHDVLGSLKKTLRIYCNSLESFEECHDLLTQLKKDVAKRPNQELNDWIASVDEKLWAHNPSKIFYEQLYRALSTKCQQQMRQTLATIKSGDEKTETTKGQDEEPDDDSSSNPYSLS